MYYTDIYDFVRKVVRNGVECQKLPHLSRRQVHWM